MAKVLGRLPTVPEYYMEFIGKADLTQEPKQCCPFHKENTPSFSYDLKTGRWSCFGACHAHGDVVDMHMRWAHIPTREQASESLHKLYQVRHTVSIDEEEDKVPISKENVRFNAVYNTLLTLVGTDTSRANE